MNPKQREQLNDMIRENETVDNTDLIKELKHSVQITKEVNIILAIKKRMKSNTKSNNNNIKNNIIDPELDVECLKQCRFLFDNYTNIYNKLLRDQIDVKILYEFLYYLKKIEDGKLSQHDASFEIGTLLKKMYVDPVVEDKPPNERKSLPLDWNEYKNSMNI